MKVSDFKALAARIDTRPTQSRTELTPKELVVLHGLAAGMTQYEIADALCLSHETIRSRVQKLRGVLDARNLTHAVAIALRRGFIE